MKNCENQIYYICLISNKNVNFFSRASFKEQLAYMEKFHKDEIIKTKRMLCFDLFSILRKRELFHGQYFQNVDISKIGIPFFDSRSMSNKYRDMDATIFDKKSFEQLFTVTKTKALPHILNNINWKNDKVIIFRNSY